MKKNVIAISLFIFGLLVLSYPFLANIVSTTGYVKENKKYEEQMAKLSSNDLEEAKIKAVEHNKSIKKAKKKFIDPFKNGTSKAGSESYYDALNIGEVMAVLKIPKLDLEFPIYHGSGEKTLSRGVGHLENSSLPNGGIGNHSVLTAHRGLPSSELFRNLDELEIGDYFIIEVLNEVHTYKVTSQSVVLPNETTWLTEEDTKDLVTLLTCEPYMINTHRLLVTGERVPIDNIQKGNLNNSQESKGSKKIFILKIGLICLLLIVLLIYVVSKKVKKSKRKRNKRKRK